MARMTVSRNILAPGTDSLGLIQANFVMDLNTPFEANQYAKLANPATEYA
jgi:hypothetical protein